MAQLDENELHGEGEGRKEKVNDVIDAVIDVERKTQLGKLERRLLK